MAVKPKVASKDAGGVGRNPPSTGTSTSTGTGDKAKVKSKK